MSMLYHTKPHARKYAPEERIFVCQKKKFILTQKMELCALRQFRFGWTSILVSQCKRELYYKRDIRKQKNSLAINKATDEWL